MSENVDVNTYIPSSTKDLYQKNLNSHRDYDKIKVGPKGS